MSSIAPQAQTTIKPRASWEKNLDIGFVWLTRLLAFAIAAVLLWIALEVALQAFPAIQRYGLGFLSSTAWNPVKEEYGALPQIYGTLVTAFIALFLAVPIGVGTALVVSENFLPSSVQTVVVFLIELLAAIPSVVYGLWGIFVLIPILKPIGRVLHSSLGWLPIFSTPSSGFGIFPAGIVLTIMILPIITAISRDALVSLPSDLRQAAYGLGATRWETIFRVLLPAATSGIVGATMLGLGRAMGETMAVTMIIGNSNRISPSILTTGNTIASLLANQFAEADGIQIAALMYSALVLFGLTLIVNVLAELVVRSPNSKRVMFGTVMTTLVFACAIAALIPLVAVLSYVTIKGFSRLNLSVFTELPPPPLVEGGGFGSAIVGTLMMVGIAALISIPVGVLAAIYLTEFSKGKVADAIRFATNVLSGVPSIIAGVFAYGVVVLRMGHFSAIAGGIALSILMLPIIVRTTDESLQLVSRDLRQAAVGIGATKFQTVVQIVLPVAIPAIVTGTTLAIARAAGETAPLLFTALFTQFWPTDLTSPTPSLAVLVYNFAIVPFKNQQELAWAASLVLVFLVLVTSIISRLATRKRA